MARRKGVQTNCAMREFIRKAEKDGWTAVSGRKHPGLLPPGGGDIVRLPSSPSGHSWMAKVRSKMRRALRGREEK